ncbi:MAG: gliding motility-associated C-terminal domain-containing protein [Flavobacteriales bacterium]|nr:gliding motility-associated C-terminal domain-containing protein [Flavobacteriales bacterium]
MFQQIIFLVFIQIVVVQQLFAVVGAPELKCIAVGSNDDITLTWVAPADPLNEFTAYEIYHATNSTGPYTIATTINNINQLTYTYSGANLITGTEYFFIRTKFDEGTGEQSSSNSDTLQPILLNVEGLSALPVPLESQASVVWNKIHNPKITSHSDWYLIYRMLAGGAWTLVDSVQFGTENHMDSVRVCYDSAYYRIEVTDASGCVSVSKVAGDEVGDQTPPTTPQIDSVSINSLTGEVQIGWTKGSPGDIDGYIVILEIVTGGYQIDTVWGIDSTFFLDVDATPGDQSEIYGLLAFDSCWGGGTPNTSASGVSHKTIFLESELSPCDKEIQITWSHYVGWSSGISDYKIYASENGGPLVLITTLSGNNTSYIHQNLNANSNYCYYVRAVEAGGTGRTSSSNLVCLNVVVPNFPQKQYLNYVTVLGESTVEVSCYIDLAAAVQYYEIERSLDGVSGFETIKQIISPTSSRIVHVDSTVNTNTTSYFYRVTAIDVCGNSIEVSNTSNTVLTKISKGTDEYINELTWSDYSDWETFGQGVSFYNIYKSGNRIFNDPPIAIVPDYETFFEDDVSDEADHVGTFCYLIQAIESDGNIYSHKDSSRSNIVCTTISPKIYLPNAFTPNDNGLNDVFKPQISFADPENYYFAIYNRFGNLIFDTEDYSEGWDGLGAPIGVYVYYLRFSDGTSEIQEARSSITLIR